MAAYRRVYESRHLQADCQEPGSAPERSVIEYGLPFYINECVRLYQTYDTNLQSLSTPAAGRYAASATSLEIESDSWTGLN